MNKSRSLNVLGIVVAVLGVLLAVLVATVAGPCSHDDGTVSMCAASGTALVGLGVATAVVALVQVFVPNKGASLALGAVTAVLGLAIVFVPGNVTPLCMMETMHCNAVMHPTAMVLGAAIFIVAVAGVVRSARAAKA